MKFEDFKSEIEKIDDKLSVERYDEDQIVMIGLTLQDRKADDVDIFINDDVPAFRIFTDGNGNRLFRIEIGFDIVSFDILLRILDLVKKYMQEEQELNNATYSKES
ncbi:hypothetical protein [Ligilactobacillus salivarius]|uniref:hypothetical protein n=1 Tax=Ligilactobacillus salivarius TaxID=1624 RepID=UPI0023B11DE1|nr:hypothetical protein [Ligilactobacillus salivarius]MDE7522882.1 hypothetical protein [Ligilactobacillus salivarius]